jgi:hypothetical protein
MIRVSITTAAFEAIATTLPLGSVPTRGSATPRKAVGKNTHILPGRCGSTNTVENEGPTTKEERQRGVSFLTAAAKPPW